MKNRLLAPLAMLLALVAPAVALEIKSDTRPGPVPPPMAPGETGINLVDGRFFYRDEAGNRVGGLLPDLDASGYLKFRNGMVLGRFQNGKFAPLGDVSGTEALGRSLQDRFRDTLNVKDAPFNAKCDGQADDTVPLQRFFAAMAPGKSFSIPAGTCIFRSPLATTASNFELRGDSSGTTKLLYAGSATGVDLVKVGQTAGFSINVRLSGFTVDSTTKMTGGTALHLENVGRSRLRDVAAAGQDGSRNLWHGYWFDKVDMVSVTGYDAAGQEDCIRVSGDPGPGAKADLHLLSGKALSCSIGLHVGGAFGGLLVDFGTYSGNKRSLVIDTTLAAEGNRELVFGASAQFDGSSAGANIEIADTLAGDGSYFQFNGTWAASAKTHNLQINAGVGATILWTGGTLFSAGGNNVQVDSLYAVLHMVGTLNRYAMGYGIATSVANSRVTTAGVRYFKNKMGDSVGLPFGNTEGVLYPLAPAASVALPPGSGTFTARDGSSGITCVWAYGAAFSYFLGGHANCASAPTTGRLSLSYSTTQAAYVLTNGLSSALNVYGTNSRAAPFN
ncbi:glycosyl hydrolase family 28-related protein [Methylobacterium sp.]|uniref:glycosyl hydrolase family 28-related protein n=1 Tax=Methylobacterium sp. TaxID=409 RepID=UPI0025EC2AFF|nr:glycosyl hydrolase family 28-related protein [Methylobacterium sp.]MBY0258549.1 glycoside hydrolase family 55 protein [Methylobacterium sp.]